jgi:choline dehydrogenase-like flavoprotein
MSDSPNVVVIGSGPTGAMASYALIKKGIPVTLLESGIEAPRGWLIRVNGRNIFRFKHYYGFESSEEHTFTGDPESRWIYNLSPGGLSNNWTGAVPRFMPEDFYVGERLDDRYRWPVTYADLAPYYEMVEGLISITGYSKDVPNLIAGKYDFHRKLPRDWQIVSKHAAARGQGLTALPLADGPPWMLINRSTAFNSFSVLIQRLMTSPLLEFRPGSHALKLEWSGNKKKVDGVIFHDKKTGKTERLSAAAVIVACGPLHSTKLLFDSECSDFPEGLGNTEGILGKYLHDHPREWLTFELDKPVTLLGNAAYLTRKPYASSPPLLSNSWTIGVASTKDKILSLIPLKGKTVGAQVFGTMIPVENYFVEPDKTKNDEFGFSPLRIHIEFTSEVVENMVQARSHLLSIFEDAGYPASLHEVAPQLTPGTSFHYGGTIRMHDSTQYGMLNGWNQLHAVPNVCVVDASSFTTGVEKNPTLTAMALAARASEHLAEDLKKG